MKIIPVLLIVAALTFSVSTDAAPPSDESVQQLLELTQTGKMMDTALAQMDGMMKASMKQITIGETLTAAEQSAMDQQQAKMLAIIKDELSWDKMKRPFTQIYRDTFSQEEVDGLIAFYQSPAGKAFVAKQPELMKNTMAIMQQHMGPMMDKIQAMTKEAADELAAARAAK